MAEKPPVSPGETCTIEITGLGHSGEGVGRFQGFTVFVPYALPGERVDALISVVKKNYAQGRLKQILQTSPHRITPRCSIFESCGGCQLLHLDYDEQLRVKRQTVVDAITRIGKLSEVVVHPAIGAADPWFYRNKMQLPVGDVGGKTAIGCFAQGTHDIIDSDSCFIQQGSNNDIIRAVRDIVTELGILPYNERSGKGVIRHILGRVGTATGEVMVVLVTATAELPHRDLIIARLQERVAGLVSVIHNVNAKQTNVVLGNSTRTLWGKETITDKMGEFTFHISAESFFQVNTVQAAILYDTALEYAGLSGGETVVDAYCGTGTITLFLARKAALVYGIEESTAAIRDARRNSSDNGVKNVEFIVGDAAKVMPTLYKQGVRPHAIVVDPPRAGCEPRVLETFAAMAPQRIVYVSCNPASLARDLAFLDQNGYRAVEVQPVDMFPQTMHIECVVRVQRKHSQYNVQNESV